MPNPEPRESEDWMTHQVRSLFDDFSSMAGLEKPMTKAEIVSAFEALERRLASRWN